MHRALRKLLPGAEGVNQFAIALNLDIRGFSSFCHKVESPSAAMFIKRVYITLIDEYFKQASFFKPTGDGLLIIIPYTGQNVKNVVSETMESCLKAVREFDTFCKDDPMINFETSKNIGIGLSRGPACRIFSDNKTLDYSGRYLNLASRLMDVARPRGIVFDASLGVELLTPEQQKLFAKDSIYLRGVAESNSIDIWYTKDMTIIPPLYKQRLDDIEWEKVTETFTMNTIEHLMEVSPWLRISLKKEPIDPTDIQVSLMFPHTNPKLRKEGVHLFLGLNKFEYRVFSAKPVLRLNLEEIMDALRKQGMKNNWGEIQVEATYHPK